MGATPVYTEPLQKPVCLLKSWPTPRPPKVRCGRGKYDVVKPLYARVRDTLEKVVRREHSDVPPVFDSRAEMCREVVAV